MINRSENEIMKNWESVEKPIVSICCLTFNQRNFIEKALDTILMQKTKFPFEIIVRDDCSTDGTREVIRFYQKKFPRIIKPIFEKENQYSKGVNPFLPAYRKAAGKYVAILEADDYWTDELKLQKQVDFLENSPDFILSHHNSFVVSENGTIVEKIKNKHPKDYSKEEMLCAEAHILTNTILFRKVPLEFPKKYGKILNADTLFWHLLGKYGKAKYQPEILPAAYRTHQEGVWSALNSVQKLENSIAIRKILKDLLGNQPILQKRIENNIHKMIAGHLLNALIRREFSKVKILLNIIKQDKELSLVTIFKMIFILFLKKIVSNVKKIFKSKV